MPESDLKLCAELAEWRGWKPRPLCFLMTHAGCPWEPCDGKVCTYWPASGNVADCDWQHTEDCPHPDTDPVAALELLEWLVERRWGWMVKSASNGVGVYLNHAEKPMQAGYVNGPAIIALPKAIALAADEVRKRGE